MFVDASALAAILLGEPDARSLAERLESAGDPVTSPLSVYETVLAVARERGGGIGPAREDVDTLLDEAGIRIVPIEMADATVALAAFDHFGKGSGHPARLNMGDCFAYACTRRRGTTLLFEGDDFSRTDIAT